MPLGQGWLNAWVKVNNKHVVYKRGEKDGEDGPTGSVHSSYHSASSGKHPGKSSGTISSGKTAQTSISEGVETQTIQRVNNRKHRRRLHKTKSASDLIREQAKQLGRKPELESVLDVSTSTQATVERTGGSALPKKPLAPGSIDSQSIDRGATIVEPDDPIRFVASFLGTDVDTLSLGRHSVDESANLDSASLQWVPQTQELDAMSLPSRGGYSLPARAQTPQEQKLYRSSSNESGSKIGFRFPTNIFSNDNSSKCRNCTKYENELAAGRDDMEYLRSVALRNEYSCSSCKAQTSQHPKEAEFPSSSLDLNLRNTDRLLEEVTARHKAQLEQLTKDRQRWQRDAQVKLQKYAGLCKDLNDEATTRNEEVISLHKEVDSLRLERDEMAGELETAQATIVKYERDAHERKLMETKLQYYESKGLDEADSAIKTRDAIIDDLSARLRKTLDILQVEREQQRQRRQIIFPTQRTSVSADQQDIETELNSTRFELEEVRSELHSLRRTSRQRETEWKTRIETLEGRLKVLWST